MSVIKEMVNTKMLRSPKEFLAAKEVIKNYLSVLGSSCDKDEREEALELLYEVQNREERYYKNHATAFECSTLYQKALKLKFALADETYAHHLLLKNRW